MTVFGHHAIFDWHRVVHGGLLLEPGLLVRGSTGCTVHSCVNYKKTKKNSTLHSTERLLNNIQNYIPAF